ncbi:hypothetical protein ACI1MP_37395 (plasmid) [Kitasatospora griseola]|uniref:hypothetical protein n=1 Tax=Kitasatospora griseola TaxID=2064 RepID=UPI003855C760
MKRRSQHRPHHPAQRVGARRRPGQTTLALITSVTAAVSGSVAAWALSHIPW